MKTTCGWECLLVVLVLAGGCSRPAGRRPVDPLAPDDPSWSHEAGFKELIAQFNRAADLLSKVKDAATARAADAPLQAVARRLRASWRRTSALGRPTPREEARLEAAYGKALEQAIRRWSKERERVSQIEGADEALKGSSREFENIPKRKRRGR
jgi:hypothetical protein